MEARQFGVTSVIAVVVAVWWLWQGWGISVPVWCCKQRNSSWSDLHCFHWCLMVRSVTDARVPGVRSDCLNLDTTMWRPGLEFPYSHCFSGALFAGTDSVSATIRGSSGSS